MAQVPRLQRVEPTDGVPQNARINIKVQDNSSLILNQTNDIAKVGNKVGDIFQAYENETIEKLSNESNREFTSWNDQQLEKLKQIQGDPTKAYADYDVAVKEKYEEMKGKYGDASDRVQRHVTSRLDGIVANNNVATMKQRGAQYETYQNNLYESTVDLTKKKMPVIAGYINKDDPSSTEMFDRQMNDLKTLTVKQGLRKGTVTRLADDDKTTPSSHSYIDDDGKVVRVSMSPIAKARVAKDLAEGVKQSIDVMIAGGQIEEAKMMREKYKDYLDPLGAVKIDGKFKTAGRKEEALNFLSTLKGDESSQIAKIESIQDEELKAEVIKRKHANTQKMKWLRDNKDEENYDRLATDVLNRMQSNQPFHGIADLEADKNFKLLYDNISDTKKKQAIMEMVEAPKTDNSKAVIRVNAALNGEIDVDLENMSTQKFHEEFLAGLSKASKNKYLKEFDKLKNPSFTEQRMVVKSTNTYLKEALHRGGLIDVSDMSDDDKDMLLEAQEKVRNEMSTLKVRPTEDQIRKIANQYAADIVDKKVFGRGSIEAAMGTKKKAAPSQTAGQAPKSPDTISKKPEDLSPTQRSDLKAEFNRKFGFMPKNSDPRFVNFIKSKG